MLFNAWLLNALPILTQFITLALGNEDTDSHNRHIQEIQDYPHLFDPHPFETILYHGTPTSLADRTD